MHCKGMEFTIFSLHHCKGPFLDANITVVVSGPRPQAVYSSSLEGDLNKSPQEIHIDSIMTNRKNFLKMRTPLTD